MAFEDRLTQTPRPVDKDVARDAVTAFSDLSAPMAEFLGGVAGTSPYLASLLRREHDWLRTALDDPEEAVLRTLRFAASQETDAPRRLRAAKRRIALLPALADLGGVWPLETVTQTLTNLADVACQSAIEEAIRPIIRRGKLPALQEDTPLDQTGLAVFAMGKMGAGELNYSSDIDLIVLFDDALFDRADYAAMRTGFVQMMRRAKATLSDLTQDGYVFRTDLRVRPDPSVTPIVVAMDAAERYYESLGRTWERAAWIKARPCAGDVAAGQRFAETMSPFIWRKHLDFAAIEDAHNMRLAIRDHKGGHGAITLPGHDLKLGRGGIREIEFFTQTRQLISGGRDPNLRVQTTKEGLSRLASAGWVPEETAQNLSEHYTFLRNVEHRVQMIRDAQTHVLPKSGAEFVRLASMMDYEPDALKTELLDRLSSVHGETEGFFAPSQSQQRTDEPDQVQIITPDHVQRWRGFAALRSDRSGSLFERILPRFETCLARASKPEEALAALESFLSRLPAGVQLFSLFDANPQLIDLLVDITGTVPALARYLAQNASVFDAVIGGDFFAPWPGRDTLERGLTDALARARDYEDQLDVARRWNKEWHFRVGVHLLRDLISPQEAALEYGSLAQATLRALWPAVQANFATRHGALPGQGAAILGMGSLGVGALSPSSDLDLIVIYDAGHDDMSDGARPLPARTYYARLTQALITSLTTATAAGRLYEVDMRLRPSGNQGPVATSWASFQDYQTNQAWVWEHLALTRAQSLAAPPAWEQTLSTFIEDLIGAERDSAEVFSAVADMQSRIAATRPATTPWNVKVGAGRIQDIDLIAQAGLLLAHDKRRESPAGLLALHALGHLSAQARDDLISGHKLQTGAQIGLRLLGLSDGAAMDVGEGGQGLLARATHQLSFEAAQTALKDCQTACADHISALLQTDQDEGRTPDER